jgi:2-alkyl-3-oxoalkanoate reductase
MRVFVAGATGAIGRPLVRMLVRQGHEVTGMTRSEQKADALRAAGAEPVVCDALDATAVQTAVLDARPEAVIHQLTAIPRQLNPRRIDRGFALTNRLRREGTRNLLSAARRAGAERFVAQSVAFVYEPNGSDRPHDEDDPLHTDVPESFRPTFEAVRDLETQVCGAGGTVLRYGYFYGRGTAVAADGSLADQARKRQLPIVGDGQGTWSFIHVDDAARAAVAALEGPVGVYNVVDDEPAQAREWIPAFIEAVEAPRPMHIPAFIARLAAGDYATLTMTKVEGASNARAKQQLGWSPERRSWREGFRDGLG